MPQDTEVHFEIRTSDGCMLRGLHGRCSQAPDTAPTAVCIHGFSANVDSMRWLAGALKEAGLNTVIPDMRGHGLSDSARRRGLGADDLAKDVIEIARQLGLTKLIVVTQSYGGWVGLRLLEEKASGIEIEKLYAFAPNWFFKARPRSEMKEWIPRSARILWRLGRRNGFFRRRKPARLDYSRFAGQPDFHIPRMEEEARSMSWLTFARRFTAIQEIRHRPGPEWKAMQELPVTLIGARQDRMVENTELEKIADQARWPLMWIDCGHLGVATDKDHAQAMAAIIQADLSSD